jgi:mRNA-degrading endonuclease RelE of RelBE toxin-antitoxin system
LSYKVSLTSPAGKDYDKLDPQVKEDIHDVLHELGDSPNDQGEKLSGYKGARRIKISPDAPGTYRAAYYTVEDLNEVVIFAIGTRENFYDLVARRAKKIYQKYFS